MGPDRRGRFAEQRPASLGDGVLAQSRLLIGRRLRPQILHWEWTRERIDVGYDLTRIHEHCAQDLVPLGQRGKRPAQSLGVERSLT